jgi:hypothetical protein
MKKKFEEEKLVEKLKVRGSLYGVPSTQYSKEKEMLKVKSKMPPMIMKPNNFLGSDEIQ